jgi:ferredoxin
MFDRSKCDLCGDCLVKCPYVNYDREKAVQEMIALIEDREAEILKECITCVACNEYCTKGANPFDLICLLQEKTNALMVPEKLASWFDRMPSMPSGVVRGTPNKQILSLCILEQGLPSGAIEGQMFDGLTIVKGGEYFCYIPYVHVGRESLIKQNAQRFVDKLTGLGAKEIVLLHDDCYSMLTKKIQDYSIKVPFKPIHIIDYLLNYLGEHRKSITKVNKKIAYQRPCGSRYTPAKEQMLDELFELIGVERVVREYDREKALCCGFLPVRTNPKRGLEIQNRNLIDAKEHGAGGMVFLCPMCLMTLGPTSQALGLSPIFLTDLCRMALGEKSFPS